MKVTRHADICAICKYPVLEDASTIVTSKALGVTFMVHTDRCLVEFINNITGKGVKPQARPKTLN